MSDLTIRQMTAADLDGAVRISAAAFEFDAEGEAGRRWSRRVHHSLGTDPAGAFVAVRGDELIGVAQAIARDRVWILSLLTVDPGLQSLGAGRALLSATLDYRADLQDKLIVSSKDFRAMRLYARAGFELHPALDATGRVDAARIPALNPEITEVTAAEVPQLAPISQALRGGEHTLELREFLSQAATTGAKVFRLADRGFCAASAGRGLWICAATDDRAATDLLWRGIAHSTRGAAAGATAAARTAGGEIYVRVLTGAQQWAFPVVLEAGLKLELFGGICIKGNPGPLHPYLPTTPYA